VYTGVAMMAFMHFYMKFTQPLFIQSLMGLKGLYDSKIIQVVLLGKKEERPFKVASMFGGASIHVFVTGAAAPGLLRGRREKSAVVVLLLLSCALLWEWCRAPVVWYSIKETRR
jgi:hypothetical protein